MKPIRLCKKIGQNFLTLKLLQENKMNKPTQEIWQNFLADVVMNADYEPAELTMDWLMVRFLEELEINFINQRDDENAFIANWRLYYMLYPDKKNYPKLMYDKLGKNAFKRYVIQGEYCRDLDWVEIYNEFLRKQAPHFKRLVKDNNEELLNHESIQWELLLEEAKKCH